jgi:hypothetical protein
LVNIYWRESEDTAYKHFWKYISKFKKNDQAVTQLELGTKIITEPQSIAEAFEDDFSSVFDSSCRPKAPYYFDHTCSDILNVPYICDSYVNRAISHLRSTKSVGPDEIPNFIIKGCYDIFSALLRHIFNLGLSTVKFPSLWEQPAVFSYFQER